MASQMKTPHDGTGKTTSRVSLVCSHVSLSYLPLGWLCHTWVALNGFFRKHDRWRGAPDW